MTIVHHLAHDNKQLFYLLGCQDGCWFVKDKQGCPPVERFNDLYPLLLTNRKLPDICIRLNLESVNIGQFCYPRSDRIHIC